MLGTLITVVLITTPVVGLIWLAFLIWEALSRP